MSTKKTSSSSSSKLLPAVLAICSVLVVVVAWSLPQMIPPLFDLHPPRAHPSKTMAAMVYQTHGDPSVLEYDTQHPQPIPKAHQYLIQVHASALNPCDFKQRRNPHIPNFVSPVPRIPGADMAGVVVQTPQSSNSKFLVGDRVAALIPYWGTPWGTMADYVAVDEAHLAKLGPSLNYTEAASYALTGLTVLQSFANLEHDDSLQGKKLLVHAGAGGVGSFAIQWAKHILQSAHVATTASAPKAEFLKELGADQVIDYRTEKFEEILLDYDVVLDPMSWLYEDRSLQVLTSGGHYVNVVGSDWAFDDGIERGNGPTTLINFITSKVRNFIQPNSTPKYGFVGVSPNGAQMQQILDAMESGKIRPVIDRTYHLSEAAEAYRYLEEGRAKGKVVLYHGEMVKQQQSNAAEDDTGGEEKVSHEEVVAADEGAEESHEEKPQSATAEHAEVQAE
ncbi:alkenal/one oxidoreductase, chloroplastic [Seminavis robusta]|uniref:Alkenal/one oxidoreductase, chloroplastic n=1 Tax=Seminavis robusta TaxID=568900 RepID=A0A9N8E9M4_9STRA|nr:alkenal/one oxidoreductase, chloroplastic [Seminavis robusta]|eukprot:Sro777_g200990.1 alkenal/one oxidoreductase, chloroplastic (449) ;mRNA; f:11170-12516